MKTKNKIQKTVLKSLAAFSFFTLISLTVTAKDLCITIIENKTGEEIALANIENVSESQPTTIPAKKSTESNSSETLFMTESEKTMVLEKWMTNDTLFKVEENPAKKKIIRTATFVFEETKDSKLEFEDWMFNPVFWRVRK